MATLAGTAAGIDMAGHLVGDIDNLFHSDIVCDATHTVGSLLGVSTGPGSCNQPHSCKTTSDCKDGLKCVDPYNDGDLKCYPLCGSGQQCPSGSTCAPQGQYCKPNGQGGPGGSGCDPSTLTNCKYCIVANDPNCVPDAPGSTAGSCIIGNNNMCSPNQPSAGAGHTWPWNTTTAKTIEQKGESFLSTYGLYIIIALVGVMILRHIKRKRAAGRGRPLTVPIRVRRVT